MIFVEVSFGDHREGRGRKVTINAALIEQIKSREPSGAWIYMTGRNLGDGIPVGESPQEIVAQINTIDAQRGRQAERE